MIPKRLNTDRTFGALGNGLNSYPQIEFGANTGCPFRANYKIEEIAE